MIELEKATPSKTKLLLTDSLNIELILNIHKEIEDLHLKVIYLGSLEQKNNIEICNETFEEIPKGKVLLNLECKEILLKKKEDEILTTENLNEKLNIPLESLFGNTSIVVSGSVKNKEILRVGFIVNVQYPGIPNKYLEETEVYENESINKEDESINKEDESINKEDESINKEENNSEESYTENSEEENSNISDSEISEDFLFKQKDINLIKETDRLPFKNFILEISEIFYEISEQQIISYFDTESSEEESEDEIIELEDSMEYGSEEEIDSNGEDSIKEDSNEN